MTRSDEPEDLDREAPARRTKDLLPQRLARVARRLTLGMALVAFAVFLFKFDTRWVPPGMNTVDGIPGGSWVVLDSWLSGLRVGSDVMIETPHGLLVSRVSAIDGDEVTITHPNPDATWGDSRTFGALPIEQVQGTVLVVFAPSTAEEPR